MRIGLRKLGIVSGALLLGVGLSVTSLFAAGKASTFTGEVGDAMCGAKHEMDGSKSSCTRECIQQGSKYALISGDKVYTLETSDKELQGKLDKLAGEQAKISGTAEGTTIQVTAVAAK